MSKLNKIKLGNTTYDIGVDWSNVSNTPTTLSGYGITDGGGGGGTPAWTDITDKPTTIDGYGITDAKIDNGIITLGNNTIAPLTSVTTNFPKVNDSPGTEPNFSKGQLFWYSNSSGDSSDLCIMNRYSGYRTILTSTNAAAVATSGSYNDLNDQPTIPTIPSNISAFNNNVGYITSPFSETGTITSNNYGWYDAGTIITGTYALMGDMCILRAYAGTKSGWGEVHYTLPVAAAQGASAVAYENGHQYIIHTGTQSNISVCTIIKVGGGNQEGDDTIHFTLIYRYQ